MPYRRPGNKGQKCKTWQRKRGRLTCKSYTSPPRMIPMGFRRGHVPANLGAKCTKRQKVYSPWFDKQVWRCAKFGGKRNGNGARRNGSPPGIRYAGPGNGGRPSLPPPSPVVTAITGYIPLALPSMERASVGRTPLRSRMHGGRPRPLWQFGR